MFKNTANTSKNYSLNTYDLKYIDISEEKNNILKTESVFEKGCFFLQIVNLLHEKCTWPFKKLHGKQKMPYASRESANNRNNIKTMHWVLHHTCTGTKKTTSFEPQSAPNLHRDKQKPKVLNFKVHQTCTGTKKTKNTKALQSTWEEATIPLESFLFFLPLCRFCALWSSKLF